MANRAAKSKFIGNLLEWPVSRTGRSFRVFVVEPKEYLPSNHAAIFNSAITALVLGRPAPLDLNTTESTLSLVEPFDLITFPEAFLPIGELITTLNGLSRLPTMGCVHVGLRPTENITQHLFGVHEIEGLVESLKAIPRTHSSDFDAFTAWLQKQGKEKKFNIGCLFMIDAEQKMRICLHPKIVRSKDEVKPLHEQHMTEANLLTLITLRPDDTTLKSVTLQPLICSDALHLSTDRPDSWPLDGANHHADCFGEDVPDHIDIVSLVTCTPQPNTDGPKGMSSRTWHQDFLDAFRRAASELHRHYSSTFVFSNFQELSSHSPGGLSGGFMPMPLREHKFPSYVTVSAWGRNSSTTNRWSAPDDDITRPGSWKSLGYVAALIPDNSHQPTSASILGFTVLRFPRDTSRWKPEGGFVDFQLHRSTSSSGTMIFEKVEPI